MKTDAVSFRVPMTPAFLLALDRMIDSLSDVYSSDSPCGSATVASIKNRPFSSLR
jgi:hypothetical protein